MYSHIDDTSLNEPGSTASWNIQPPVDEKKGWRHIRIQQKGRNSSGQTSYLSLSGFEIYGTVTEVCDDLGRLKCVTLVALFLPQCVANVCLISQEKLPKKRKQI